MVLLPTLLALFVSAIPVDAGAAPVPLSSGMARSEANLLYTELGLAEDMAEEEFSAVYNAVKERATDARMLAIADMTRPSTEPRLTVIDLDARVVVMRTLVAHGQGTGDLMAEHFSNTEGSHQTSLGLYRVGAQIVSPKHGKALLLHGLDHGVNDQALAREIIMHGADYVSEEFIAAHGRLGRSWGCPAVPKEQMTTMVQLLGDGGLLYVYHR
ncbi:MAG: murein L,D-transpeptidase catalytic domain family protein [Flavobacteriales bacterium]|nr:murein L,D-transpeptidase catalytic domain family protein [Flavobacteriales bacterium]MBP6697561.1 murein L,D-transpeptidase catalytic domain family protein [Flavobacteriales bacterium]